MLPSIAKSILTAAVFIQVITINAFAQPTTTENWKASGSSGAIATGSRQAADAGLAMLKSGGNAIDAAVSALLVQTVVETSLYCFGGEVPIIVYDAQRDVVEVIAGLGAAPRLATPQWFRENRDGLIQGRGDPANAVVPGTLDACITALDRYGTRSFGKCAEAMVAILRQRSKMTPEERLSKSRRRRSRGTAEQQIKRAEQQIANDKNFLNTIERLVAAERESGKDRKSGLRAVADYFYRGPIARELDAWSRENGGLLRFTDMAQHFTRIDEPISIQWRGHTIYKCGVWTQGPFLLQTFRLLDGFDLDSLDHDSADYIHLVTEAMKLGFADRDAFYGDPAFVHVPIQELLSDQYTSLRRPLIKMGVASQEQQTGNPFKMQALLGVAPRDHKVSSGHSNDTSNCLVADRWGNVVAATPSGWGGVMAGETGIQLGSRMIGLNTWEDHPSIVAPGKRPRITLTPTLVCKDGKPVLAVSVAGGDQQDQASIQIILNRLVFDYEPADAVRTPRFSTKHHINWFGHIKAQPGTLTVNRDTEGSVVDNLKQRGHKVSSGRTAGVAVLLAIDRNTGMKHAAGDRSRNAKAY